MSKTPTRSPNEGIKEASRYLRGTIAQGLTDVATGALADDDQQLTKFHGIYLQDDRDLRGERTRKKLEKAFSFMARVRIPGGILTTGQWLALDAIADSCANGTLRITTRQTVQFHGIIKSNLKPAIRRINEALLDTVAACGDVNRNVMCNPNPLQSRAHAAAIELARAISEHLLPRTRAYHEIWIDGEKVAGGEPEPEDEAIYGRHYLPRKFKAVVAVPPSNDVDVYAQDLAFIAIVEDGAIVGYDVTVGGGMGMTHGEPETFPRTADVLGFCTPEQAVQVAEAVLVVQRDFGDRANRKHARLKYTIEDRGLEWFRAEVEGRLGFRLEPARPFTFDSTGDRFGWVADEEGRWHYTLFVENGRVKGDLRTAMREIAHVHRGDFRLTANQNLIIADVGATVKATIDDLLQRYRLIADVSALRRSSMACVALPTCGLALAESERYLPDLLTELEAVTEQVGLRDDEIVVRMTGCPNGCARPYLCEIGFVGRSPGVYNVYLGGSFDGSRLNKLYRRDVRQERIVELLTPLIDAYAGERLPDERFGDFVIRAGYIAPTLAGNRFHADLSPNAEMAA